MTDRRIEYRALDELEGAIRNAKSHNLDAIIGSLRHFGIVDVIGILDDRTGRLVGGHGRVVALRMMHANAEAPPNGISALDGQWFVPVLVGWSSISDAEADAANVALNQLTISGGWDEIGLARILADMDRDLARISFSDDEIDALLKRIEEPPPLDDDDVIRPPEVPVTQPGDVWLIGRHALVCGDATDRDTWATILDVLHGRSVGLAFTSPPYADRRRYDPDSGFELVHPDDYVAWFEPVAGHVASILADDGSWFVNIRAGNEGLDRELYVLDLVRAHVAWGWHWADEFCWERNGVPQVPTTRFRNQFEPIYHFTRGRWKFRPEHVRHLSEHIPKRGRARAGASEPVGAFGHLTAMPNDAPGTIRFEQAQGTRAARFDDTESGLAYPGNRLPTFAGSHEATGHTAAFPVGLPEFFVKAYTDPADVVLDPFAGSGSTLLAAHRTDRVGIGVELSAAYCDVVVERFERRYGVTAERVTADT